MCNVTVTKNDLYLAIESLNKVKKAKKNTEGNCREECI